MKNIIKTIAIAAIAVTLSGCAENNKSELDVNEIISNAIEANSTTTTSEVESKPVESSTTSTVEKPVEKPVASSTTTTSTTTSKPAEKPTSSTTSTIASKPVESKPSTKTTSSTSSTTSTKPVEKPKPTSSSSTTASKPIEKPTTSTPTAPVEKVHNCKTDGHVWKEYTKTSTEEVEIEEIHTVYANGYDRDLAKKYFGASAAKVDFRKYFGTVYGNGSSKVKTTGTKTITTFYHECTECGHIEAYDTKEEVIPGETWEFVYGPRDDFYPVVWYDINNIPAEILEGREKEKAFEEDVWASF